MTLTSRPLPIFILPSSPSTPKIPPRPPRPSIPLSQRRSMSAKYASAPSLPRVTSPGTPGYIPASVTTNVLSLAARHAALARTTSSSSECPVRFPHARPARAEVGRRPSGITGVCSASVSFCRRIGLRAMGSILPSSSRLEAAAGDVPACPSSATMAPCPLPDVGSPARALGKTMRALRSR